MSQILIAEDEPRIASMIEKSLQRKGFATAVAQDGSQAIRMAQSGDFDLLLLDLGLPIKDGWTVLQELRTQGMQLPIIIVTASEDVRDRAAGFQGGANDYVTKPFSFKDLLDRVQVQLSAR